MSESVKCENCLFFLISLVQGVTIILIFSRSNSLFHWSSLLLFYCFQFHWFVLLSLLFPSFWFFCVYFLLVSSFLSRSLDYWFEFSSFLVYAFSSTDFFVLALLYPSPKVWYSVFSLSISSLYLLTTYHRKWNRPVSPKRSICFEKSLNVK